MNTTSAVLLTGAIVVAGKWSDDKPLDVKLAIGILGLAIGLAIMNETNAELAGKFATLVVVAAVFMYGPPVAKKAGLIK